MRNFQGRFSSSNHIITVYFCTTNSIHKKWLLFPYQTLPPHGQAARLQAVALDVDLTRIGGRHATWTIEACHMLVKQ